MTLSPEGQEELRKREKCKDKLHQAYLRRKESGWQRKYEERTKTLKKAEMDAKKAAIHNEDIQKGVFVLVSHLSKQEPQKVDRQHDFDCAKQV